MKERQISVVVCTFNGERYIREQLDSIINQTVKITEIIIQDDRSTDKTWEILNEYARKYPYVRIFQNEVNLGCDENFFTALAKATGEYIAISDQDDIWVQDKIEKQLKGFATEPECLLSAHDTLAFTGNDIPAQPLPLPRSRSAVTLEKMITSFGYAGHTMLIKNSLIETILSKLPLTTRQTCESLLYYDQIILLAALSMGKICYHGEYLSLHRRQENSLTIGTVQYNGAKNTIRLVLRGIRNKHNAIIKEILCKRFCYQQNIIEAVTTDCAKTRQAIEICHCYQHPSLASSIKLLHIYAKTGSNWSKGIKGTVRNILTYYLIYSILPAKERREYEMKSTKKQ